MNIKQQQTVSGARLINFKSKRFKIFLLGFALLVLGFLTSSAMPGDLLFFPKQLAEKVIRIRYGTDFMGYNLDIITDRAKGISRVDSYNNCTQATLIMDEMVSASRRYWLEIQNLEDKSIWTERLADRLNENVDTPNCFIYLHPESLKDVFSIYNFYLSDEEMKLELLSKEINSVRENINLKKSQVDSVDSLGTENSTFVNGVIEVGEQFVAEANSALDRGVNLENSFIQLRFTNILTKAAQNMIDKVDFDYIKDAKDNVVAICLIVRDRQNCSAERLESILNSISTNESVIDRIFIALKVYKSYYSLLIVNE